MFERLLGETDSEINRRIVKLYYVQHNRERNKFLWVSDLIQHYLKSWI